MSRRLASPDLDPLDIPALEGLLAATQAKLQEQQAAIRDLESIRWVAGGPGGLRRFCNGLGRGALWGVATVGGFWLLVVLAMALHGC